MFESARFAFSEEKKRAPSQLWGKIFLNLDPPLDGVPPKDGPWPIRIPYLGKPVY